mgnify:CR=1 FL=1
MDITIWILFKWLSFGCALPHHSASHIIERMLLLHLKTEIIICTSEASVVTITELLNNAARVFA